MKKIILILMSFSFFVQKGIAQAIPPDVQLIDKPDTIAPLYNDSGKNVVQKTFTVDVKLLLNVPYSAAKNFVILEIKKGALPFTFSFVSGEVDTANASLTKITIPKSEWPAAAGADPKTYVAKVKVKMESSSTRLTDDESGQIVIRDHADNFHTLIFSNKAESLDTKYKPNKPFWIEVGANFDLIDGMKPNNPFFGVFFHKRDIRPFSKQPNILANNAHKNLGVFAGVFESRTITTTETDDFFARTYFNNTSFIPGNSDSVKLFKDAGKYAVKKSVNNVGLFFSPQLRLTNGSANEDGLHVFFSLWLELQWQQVKFENDFTNLVRVDSTVVPMDSIGNYTTLTSNAKNEIDVRSHYLGIGLPLFFRENDVQLFLNPVIGFSNQLKDYQFNDFIKNKMVGVQRSWSPFYAVQFRLNEEKYGISFTGEVRGLFAKGNPPYVSIALSKKFDLNKFMEFK